MHYSYYSTSTLGHDLVLGHSPRWLGHPWKVWGGYAQESTQFTRSPITGEREGEGSISNFGVLFRPSIYLPQGLHPRPHWALGIGCREKAQGRERWVFWPPLLSLQLDLCHCEVFLAPTDRSQKYAHDAGASRCRLAALK